LRYRHEIFTSETRTSSDMTSFRCTAARGCWFNVYCRPI